MCGMRASPSVTVLFIVSVVSTIVMCGVRVSLAVTDRLSMSVWLA